MKACARAVAATDGDVFARLVVIFLKRTFLCIRAARVGALLLIREIGPNGMSSIGFPLLLTVGGVSSICLKKRKTELPIGIKVINGLEHRLKAYSVLGDLVLGVDHAAVCEGRSVEQVIFLFLPPLFICLSNEESWDRSR